MNTTDLMDAASAKEMADFSSNAIFTKRYHGLLTMADMAIRRASRHGLYATNISYRLDSVTRQRFKKELVDRGYGVEFFQIDVTDLIERPELKNTSIIISWGGSRKEND